MARISLLVLITLFPFLYYQIPTSSSGGGGSSASIGLDNSIVSSSVDASGNPNFLGTAANTVLPINGNTTNLVMYIGGVSQTLSTDVTITLPTTASVQQWILAKQDLAPGGPSLLSTDFVGMNTPPFYGYVAPTCPSPSPALSATNPAYWFDLATNKGKLCTSNGGAYVSSPSIVIGVVDVNATPAIDFVLPEPFRLSPHLRTEFFGSGSDGSLTVTSGTTTLTAAKEYTSVVVTGGTVNHTSSATASINTVGIQIRSQNPILYIGGSITAKGLGRVQSAGGTSTGTAGVIGGIGGSGGGGGGSGVTSAAGGAGGSKFGMLQNNITSGGGTAGAITPTAGGAGTLPGINPGPTRFFVPNCSGATGGNGGGDGTNNGGTGGAGGGYLSISAPSILIASGLSLTADGGNGGNGAAGNAGGGGGGGGGCLFISYGYLNSSGATISAASGTIGNGVGTGQAGGLGSIGISESFRIW